MNEPRPDLAALMMMIEEGRKAELTDLELMAVVLGTAPERAAEVLQSVIPDASREPTAEEVCRLELGDIDGTSAENRQIIALVEFLRRYRTQKGIVE
ncbi:MAG TPA: hypothetical protein VMH22_07180 [bacterium]|nr:hypothetical protein [bacterium]